MDNKEAKKLMKLHNHKFGYCSNCGPIIYCGFCGNNCCNGGSGKYINGIYIPCIDDCNEAYEIQSVIKFPILYRIRNILENVIWFWINRYIRVPISNYFYNLKKDK